MRKIRTITLMALLVVMLVAYTQPIGAQTGSDGLPAYTGGSAELRMGWWGNDDRAERTLQVIELFEAAYPEIKIIGEPNGGTADHFQILDTQLGPTTPPTLSSSAATGPITSSTLNRSMTISANSS